MLHSYLGACEHVGGGVSLLEEGTKHRLPTLILPVVVLPGSTLPLHVTQPAEIAVLQRAMSAPAPVQRLLVVLYWPSIRHNPRIKHLVGCTAEIKQFGMGGPANADSNQGGADSSNGGAWTAVARGRQRVLVDLNEWDEQGRAPALVLSEGCTQRLPRPWALGYASLPPALCKPWDLATLSSMATRLCREVLPEAQHALSPPGSSPLQLSYALAANLPMQGASRQNLLECNSPAERLRKVLTMLRKLGQLVCTLCRVKVADVSQTLAMTTEGVAAAFVNQHGYVHDLVTLAQLADSDGEVVRYQGQPETEFSWFPGYAWTICNCRTCGMHLGWRFTATKPDLQPAQFWGLRRDALWSRAYDVHVQPPHAQAEPPQGDEEEWRSAESGDGASSEWGVEDDSEEEGLVVVQEGDGQSEQDSEEGEQEVEGQVVAAGEGDGEGDVGGEADGEQGVGGVSEQEREGQQEEGALGHRQRPRSVSEGEGRARQEQREQNSVSGGWSESERG